MLHWWQEIERESIYFGGLDGFKGEEDGAENK